jgi:DNA-binding NarL/FixJ family response regulator
MIVGEGSNSLATDGSQPPRTCASRSPSSNSARASGSWLIDQLSPQELQIAEMAAQGLTNRDIGEKLFLSHRTIGSHLYRAFPKLRLARSSRPR